MVRKLKGSWWVDFCYARRRYRKRSPLNSRGGAASYEVTLRQRLARGESLDETHAEARVTFAAFAAKWLEIYVGTNNKPSEQENKRWVLSRHLMPFFGTMLLEDIDTYAVERYKSRKRSESLAAKTINNHLTVLRKSLNVAVEWGVIEHVPTIRALKVAAPKFKYLSPEEAERLIGAAPQGFWRAFVIMALKTGMRFSELVALRWEDVRISERQLCVHRSNVRGHVGVTKSYRVRYIPLTGDVIAELESLPRSHELVFAFRGTWLRHEAARRHLLNLCDRAEVPNVGWHALRHTFASTLATRGAPLRSVQDLLGHSTITMTMRYAHVSGDSLRETVSLLDPTACSVKFRQPAVNRREIST
ncbi:MAG: tyrosine-type recombinase/integrase [Polyangiaceae bacterium]